MLHYESAYKGDVDQIGSLQVEGHLFVRNAFFSFLVQHPLLSATQQYTYTLLYAQSDKCYCKRGVKKRLWCNKWNNAFAKLTFLRVENEPFVNVANIAGFFGSSVTFQWWIFERCIWKQIKLKATYVFLNSHIFCYCLFGNI